MTGIVICADDFGFSKAIDGAIIDLVNLERISAVSCMTTGPSWPLGSRTLKEISTSLDIGLHFDLTEFTPLSTSVQKALGRHERSPLNVLLAICKGNMTHGCIAVEFKAQLGAFKDVFGRYPDYIDSHHHIHQWPVIRRVIIGVLKQHLLQESIYIRNTFSPLHSIFRNTGSVVKTALLSFLGYRFQRLAKKNGIPTNTSFSGVYSFSDGFDYGDRFTRFIKNQPSGALLMCHPAHAGGDNDHKDIICDARLREFVFLKSDGFSAALRKHDVRVKRFAFGED